MKKRIADAVQKLQREQKSFYLYDEEKILEQTGKLKQCYPSVSFLYSVKCNPFPEILDTVFSQGFGADAASIAEVRLAVQHGLRADQIFFSAPGRSRKELEEGLQKSVVIADSIGEIGKIASLAVEQDTVYRIGVRINPEFSFDEEKGFPSRFGIDEEQLEQMLQKGLPAGIEIIGIHVHIRSQVLDPMKITAGQKRILALADRLQEQYGLSLSFLNLGSGIGVPYGAEEKPLPLEECGNALEASAEAYRRKYPKMEILIETGRFAVCEAGYYVTEVMDRKVSHGKVYLILNSTMNGFLRPSLARMIEHYASEEETVGCEPLFTEKDEFRIETLKASAPRERVTLCGRLCTAADVIAEEIELPVLQEGDCVILTHAGSYGASLSPVLFSSLEKPAEFLLKTEKGER